MDKEKLQENLVKLDGSRIDQVLLILWFCGNKETRVSHIKKIGKENGIPEIARWNVSDILRKKNSYAINLKNGWKLTSKGKKRLKEKELLESEKDLRIKSTINNLKSELKEVKSEDSKRFLNEAISCYEVGFYRSSVVLSWCGAISLLHHHVVKNCLSIFNKEAKRRNGKWKPAKKEDDLGRMKESTFLDIIASPPLSIIGKNLKEDLKNNCLALRNSCGHPNSYRIGENKVAAHLEILTLNIFSKF